VLDHSAHAGATVCMDQRQSPQAIGSDYAHVMRLFGETHHQYVADLEDVARNQLAWTSLPYWLSRRLNDDPHHPVAVWLPTIALEVRMYDPSLGAGAPDQAGAIQSASTAASMLERNAQEGASGLNQPAHGSPFPSIAPGVIA